MAPTGTQTTPAQRAITKALAERPLVARMSAGQFKVRSGSQRCYRNVSLSRARQLTCDCPAGQNGRDCYHAGAVALFLIAREQPTERRVKTLAPREND